MAGIRQCGGHCVVTVCISTDCRQRQTGTISNCRAAIYTTADAINDIVGYPQGFLGYRLQCRHTDKCMKQMPFQKSFNELQTCDTELYMITCKHT